MRVGSMVRQLVGACSVVVHKKRVAAAVKGVEGILRCGRLSPASIGRTLPGRARPKHGIKCVDRLLGNARFSRDRLFFFLAIAHRLLRGCARPFVLVDWTHCGGKQEALVAAVPIGGRALPIYLEVHPQKKLGNVAVETRFLSSLRAVLPAECRPIMVSDAGFKGPFFQAVLDLEWDFVGRVRGPSVAFNTDENQWVTKDELYSRASITPTDLGAFKLFVRRPIPCRLVLVRKRRKPGRRPPPPRCQEERELRRTALDPWLLATSLREDDASFIVGIYRKRMQIEETFRDAKNHRFGWSLDHVRLSTPRRTAALLVLAALALIVATLIGMGAEAHGAHRAYQANTERRRVLSFFVLACAVLRRRDSTFLSLNAFRLSLASIARLAST
jgi:hypothetical protein